MADTDPSGGGTKTIVFFPEGAYGPTSNCVGIGDVLRRRGHRVVFAVEESFTGRLAAHGFEERLVRLGPPPAEPEAPGQFWKDFIRDTAPEFRKPTLDQLERFIAPTWQALVDGARYVERRLREIFAEVAPDVIVEDNVVGLPAVVTHGAPWVRIVSCNPAELRDPGVPPAFSGYPARGPDRLGQVPGRIPAHGTMWTAFNQFVMDAGAPPLADLEFIHESAWLNLWLYPAEADYRRHDPLARTSRRLESAVRATDGPFQIPAELATRPGRLLYLSLGSLVSADVALMQRLIDVLGRSPYRVIVSLGPQHQVLSLHPNMLGAEFLPQPAILPQVDLVITHCGNNTVTECFRHGRPMVVLPLFWDQYDNAQRVAETGFGARLATYEFSDTELIETISRLLADGGPAARPAAVSARLASVSGTVRAADLVEQLARTREPALREGARRDGHPRHNHPNRPTTQAASRPVSGRRVERDAWRGSRAVDVEAGNKRALEFDQGGSGAPSGAGYTRSVQTGQREPASALRKASGRWRGWSTWRQRRTSARLTISCRGRTARSWRGC